VSVRNSRLGGTPLDATPFVPEAYRPYFDPGGGGGVEVLLESNPDPTCADKVDTPEERNGVYGDRGLFGGCIPPGGALRGKRVGRLRLGIRRDRALARLGPPRNHRRGTDRWCLIGKGELRVEYAPRDGPATVIRSSGRGHALHGVARGDRIARARRRLDLGDRFRLGGARVFDAGTVHGRGRFVAIAAHRVRWVAIADRHRLGARGTVRAVRRTR
jgi:hypothetical protein